MTTQTADISEVKLGKVGGLFTKKTVDIIIPFYNEEGNVSGTHESAARLEKLFEVSQYIYINNGSKDDTSIELQQLATENPKITIVHIEENIGYGNGFKKGFEASTADYIITNHADQQFDGAAFYTGIAEKLNSLVPGNSVFPVRKGRPFPATFMTGILKTILSAILGKKLTEFNGQPKLIDRSSLTQPIDRFPNGFSFDLMLYMASGNKKFYPILEQKRATGTSSWNHGLRSKYSLFKDYIDSARKMKKLFTTTPVKN